MRNLGIDIILLLLHITLCHSRTTFDHGVNLPTERPLNVAHRGSSGVLPEHTIPAYERAIQDGADLIECDVHISRDLVAICIHDVYLSATTNVMDAPNFQGRNNTYVMEGTPRNDYFVIDFTLAELKTLQSVQSKSFRDQNYNNLYPLVTLEEFINVAKEADRTVGIYPETKSPAWHNSILEQRAANTTIEDIVLQVLEKHGYSDSRDPCFLQSFEEESLMYMKQRTSLPLVMLTSSGQPSDEMLQRWSDNLYGVGAWKDQVVQHWDTINGYKNSITNRTDLVERAHNRGLKVHLYTFRNEDQYLAWDFLQDPVLEYENYMSMDVDGFFTDFPHTFDGYLDCYYAHVSSSQSLCIGWLTFIMSAMQCVYLM